MLLYAFKTFRCYILRLINKLNKNLYNNVVVNFVNSFDDRFYLYFYISNKSPLYSLRLHQQQQKQQSPPTIEWMWNNSMWRYKKLPS